MVGSYEEIREKFEKKGFSTETIDEILFRLWGGVAAESTIPLAEVAEGFFQLFGGEVRK